MDPLSPYMYKLSSQIQNDSSKSAPEPTISDKKLKKYSEEAQPLPNGRENPSPYLSPRPSPSRLRTSSFELQPPKYFYASAAYRLLNHLPSLYSLHIQKYLFSISIVLLHLLSFPNHILCFLMNSTTSSLSLLPHLMNL